MSKKLVICTTNDLVNDRRMQRIALSLKNAGYSVYWVGRLRSNSKTLDLPFPYYRLKCFFQAGKFFYLEYNLRLFFHLLFRSFDCIHAVDLDSMPAAALLAKLRTKNLVFDAHEWFTEVPEVQRRPLIRKIWKWIEHFSLPSATAIITVSSGIADYYARHYNCPVSLIRNMPFARKYQSAIPPSLPLDLPDGPFILYQGAINEGRGLEQVIRAVIASPYQLVLAGSGDLDDSLKQWCRKNDLNKQIHFLGMLDPVQLEALTAKAFIGLNLLEARSRSYYYSLANKFFDYVQASVPSIQMRFPEYMNLNAEYEVALLLNDLSIDEIRAAMDRLYADSELYERLKSNCRKAAAKWNWELEEQKLLQIYNTVLMQKEQ